MTPAKTKESLDNEIPIEPVFLNSDGQGASVLLRDCANEHNIGNSFNQYNEAHFLDFSAYDTEEEEAIVPLDGRDVERCCSRECNKILPPDLLQLHRNAFVNLKKADQDLLILSHLQQSRHSAALEIEYSKQNKVHEPVRFAGEEVSRREIEYYFLALPICRRMYFFLHPMRTKRYRNLIARFDATLISNQSHSTSKTPGNRRRGRPKKSVPIFGVNNGSELSSHVIGKRKRGRPKKSEALNGDSISSDVPRIKRKRGRPKKSSLMTDDIDMIEAHFLSAVTDENSTNGLFMKHKPGRPKKSQSIEGSEAVVCAAANENWPNTFVFKRARGRPRKSEQVTKSEEARDISFADLAMDAQSRNEFIVPDQISDIIEPTNSSSIDSTVVKRKRGRPRKSVVMVEKTSETKLINSTSYGNPDPNFLTKQIHSSSNEFNAVSMNGEANNIQTIDPQFVKRKRGRPRKTLLTQELDASVTHFPSATEANMTDTFMKEHKQDQVKKFDEEEVKNTDPQNEVKNELQTGDTDVSDNTGDSDDTEDSEDSEDSSEDSSSASSDSETTEESEDIKDSKKSSPSSSTKSEESVNICKDIETIRSTEVAEESAGENSTNQQIKTEGPEVSKTDL